MSEVPRRYVSASDVANIIEQSNAEYARVDNPPYVDPPWEYVPLRPKHTVLNEGIRAVLMDMDGTTTMTEDHCLFALETFARKAMGRLTQSDWAGLNPEQDYEHIIGHSVTANVIYLVRAYGDDFQKPLLDAAFIEACAWILGHETSPNLHKETHNDLQAVGGAALLEDEDFKALIALIQNGKATQDLIATLRDRHGNHINWDIPENLLRCGMAIYYHSLHGMFLEISQGGSEAVAQQLYGDGRKHAIVPLKGVGFLHALARGWLGDECAAMARWHATHESCSPELDDAQFSALGTYFEENPVPVALITSSADFEAHTVLKEVFKGLVDEVAQWPISEARKQHIQSGFADHNAFYATVVTASDCHETRLKPYRDLYVVGLHALGILPEDSHRVVGFEDTEAGIIALRAAGVGVPCAVPFEGTAGHDFQAASHVLPGGVLEGILQHGMFLPESLLQ